MDDKQRGEDHPETSPGIAACIEHEHHADRTEGSGRLELRFGAKGHLIIDFGRAGFDGCGGDGAAEVEINGVEGLMLAKDRYPWGQIIWPAQPGDSQATYGIYGSLRGPELLELARSMQLGLEGEGTRAGC